MDIEQIRNIVGGFDLDHSEEVTGGLFNLVYKLYTNEPKYLKIFLDIAKSRSFPPLPIPAQQRFAIALEAHANAYKNKSDFIQIPKVLNANEEHSCILMSEVEGQPFYDLVTDFRVDPELIFIYLKNLVSWLNLLHKSDLNSLSRLVTLSKPFKEYKISLQYLNLLQYLDYSVNENARIFIKSYLDIEEQIVHGDFNSRNILLNPNNHKIAIIDFEQAHIGSGIYDVAYIFSEFIIRLIIEDQYLIEDQTQKLLKVYSDNITDTMYNNFYKHLFFQVLYRLVGPSKEVWSYHLSELQRKQVIEFATKKLNQLFL